MSDELKRQINSLAILCKYLLFERKQESQLSMAFSILVQQRHNQLHTLGDYKNGDETLFSDCDNEICKMAFNVLKDSRQMAVEINQFTAQITDDFALKLEGFEGGVMRGWLEPKTKIEKPEGVIIQ